jgi:D-xylose reductase
MFKTFEVLMCRLTILSLFFSIAASTNIVDDTNAWAGNFRSVSTPEQIFSFVDGREFPLVISPATDITASDIPDWAHANGEILLQLALSHGAVLLRDFPIDSPTRFAEVVLGLNLTLGSLEGSAAPRNIVPNTHDVVFTANESPPDSVIPFHHEMAQTVNPPTYIGFYCDQPAMVGGATPIVLSEEVVAFIDSNHYEFGQALRTRGVRYHRTLPEVTDKSSALGKSWKETLKVDTEEEAAEKIAGMSEGWKFEDGLLHTTSHILPGIITDPRSGREVFFNQVVAAYFGWSDSRNIPEHSVTLGADLGAPPDYLDAVAMKDIEAFMQRRRVVSPWVKNDVLLIDNRAVLHSREEYIDFDDHSKKRSIMASLWQGRKNRNHKPFLGAPTENVLVLRSNDVMPKVGLGTWKIDNNVTASVVVEAIKMGYRHLDCAADYGNEKEVGEGIRQAIDSGLVTRAELWITSKLWNNYHNKEHVPLALSRTLQDLGLEYLDLYMVHFPIATQFIPMEERYPPGWTGANSDRMEMARVPMQETWTAMELLVARGLVRNIGLCNVDSAGLRDVLSYANIVPAVLQIERHLYLQQPKLLRLCKEMGVVVVGFSPLGSSSYVELCMASESDSPLAEPSVLAATAAHNKSPAQVVLRWGVQSGCGIIPKSSKSKRLDENLNVFDFALSDEEMLALSQLDKNKRFNDPGEFTTGMNSFCPIYD